MLLGASNADQLMENIGAIQVRPARLCGEEGPGPVLPCAMWEGEVL